MAKLRLKYPATALSYTQKFLFAQIAYERLRQLHNAKGADFRAGKITKKEWEEWINEYFEPRHNAIIEAILEGRAKMRQAKTYSFDPDKHFEVV